MVMMLEKNKTRSTDMENKVIKATGEEIDYGQTSGKNKANGLCPKCGTWCMGDCNSEEE